MKRRLTCWVMVAGLGVPSASAADDDPWARFKSVTRQSFAHGLTSEILAEVVEFLAK